jgi:hypothetical protein
MVFCVSIQFYIARDAGEALRKDKKLSGDLIDVDVKSNSIGASLGLH